MALLPYLGYTKADDAKTAQQTYRGMMELQRLRT